ncbi:programmed cell death protein 2-like isoform X1 [Acanthaster planci]|uniref:Programmed cell death protein 2-like isoform X1 n=1 Tax=Acanthaster planci TaxID=133434 RepID=A0A8B7YHP0_ACAPL|nr:programmed cell death protein 2-like isoform X1 [Acanthaster planci]
MKKFRLHTAQLGNVTSLAEIHWKVLRSQLLVPQSEVVKQSTRNVTKVVTRTTDEWCEDADDWGSESDEESMPINEQVCPGASNRGGNAETSVGCHHSRMDGFDLSSGVVTMETPASLNASSALNGDKRKKATGEAICENHSLSEHNEHCSLPVQDSKMDLLQEYSDDGDPSDGLAKLSISSQCSAEVTPTGCNSVLSSSQPPSFKDYFVSVFDEPLPCSASVTELTNHERELIDEYQQREGVDLVEWQKESSQTKRAASCEESYEKTTAKHGDKVFLSFAKKLQLCPEQCIRYSWCGSPLYLTSPNEGAVIPPCPYCGRQRVFEVQLMPPLINTLHDADRPDVQIDFGVVIIYTCKASCWDDPCQPGKSNLREEHVVIQADPDSALIAHATSSLVLP